MQEVSPKDLIDLHRALPAAANIARISLHLVDNHQVDRGALGRSVRHQCSGCALIRFVKGFLCLGGVALGLTAAAAGQSAPTTIKTTEDIASAFKKGDWPTYNGDYTGKTLQRPDADYARQRKAASRDVGLSQQKCGNA